MERVFREYNQLRMIDGRYGNGSQTAQVMSLRRPCTRGNERKRYSS
ncbi:MAG: hypothetical protein ACLUOI_12595 [Eisenbergiella sp.]